MSEMISMVSTDRVWTQGQLYTGETGQYNQPCGALETCKGYQEIVNREHLG